MNGFDFELGSVFCSHLSFRFPYSIQESVCVCEREREREREKEKERERERENEKERAKTLHHFPNRRFNSASIETTKKFD